MVLAAGGRSSGQGPAVFPPTDTHPLNRATTIKGGGSITRPPARHKTDFPYSTQERYSGAADE